MCAEAANIIVDDWMWRKSEPLSRPAYYSFSYRTETAAYFALHCNMVTVNSNSVLLVRSDDSKASNTLTIVLPLKYISLEGKNLDVGADVRNESTMIFSK